MTLSGSTSRSDRELRSADAEARPYYLGLLAAGWRNVVWWYEPPTESFIHEFVAQGEHEGVLWEGSSPVSAKQALLTMKWYQEGRLPYRP